MDREYTCLADALMDISRDKLRAYQAQLDVIEDSMDSSIIEEVIINLNELANKVRSDSELYNEDRRIMNQRIKRIRERYM